MVEGVCTDGVRFDLCGINAVVVGVKGVAVDERITRGGSTERGSTLARAWVALGAGCGSLDPGLVVLVIKGPFAALTGEDNHCLGLTCVDGAPPVVRCRG